MRPRLAAPSLPREIPPETPLAPPAGRNFRPPRKIFRTEHQPLAIPRREIFAPGLGGSARAHGVREILRIAGGYAANPRGVQLRKKTPACPCCGAGGRFNGQSVLPAHRDPRARG